MEDYSKNHAELIGSKFLPLAQIKSVAFFWDSRYLEKGVMSTYILYPCPTLIIRYFKKVCFREPLEGIYAFCALYVVR